MTGRVHERVKHIILLALADTLIAQLLAESSFDSLSFHKAFGVDFDFLDGQFLRNLVQSLSNLLQVLSALGLLSLHILCGFLDTVDTGFNALKLFFSIDLCQ